MSKHNELLARLEDAIIECEEEKRSVATVELTYAELLLLRRYEMANEYDIELASQNLKRARNHVKEVHGF